MSSRLNPYITFDGNAREAMEFYREVFGGELTVSTFAELGTPDGVDPEGVMHAHLQTDAGYTLMASDTAPGMPYTPGSSIAVSLSGDDDTLRTVFARLAEGGSVVVPLEKQMWGDEFGQCVDRFGIAWMVDIQTPEG